MTQQTRNETFELLCPNCLRVITAETHFCPQCLTPLSSHAATDPIGRIWASGFIYRRGIQAPRSRLIFWGFWLFFGSQFLLLLMHLGSIISGHFAGAGTTGLWMENDPSLLVIAVLFSSATAGLLGTMLYQITRNYWRLDRGQK